MKTEAICEARLGLLPGFRFAFRYQHQHILHCKKGVAAYQAATPFLLQPAPDVINRRF